MTAADSHTSLSFSSISREELRERVAALQAMAILDTPPEEGFDALTRLAAMVCTTPVAIVSLIDGERLWFKAVHGLGKRSIASTNSFCKEAADSKQPLEVPDPPTPHPQPTRSQS